MSSPSTPARCPCCAGKHVRRHCNSRTCDLDACRTCDAIWIRRDPQTHSRRPPTEKTT